MDGVGGIQSFATAKAMMKEEGGLAYFVGVQDQLKGRIESAELHLMNLKSALAMLESQPQLLETLNLLRKVGI